MRNVRVAFALTVAVCSVGSSAPAQSVATPVPGVRGSAATAAECRNGATAMYDAAYKAAEDSTSRKLIKAIDFRAISDRMTSELRQCVARLDPNKLSGDNLLDLAREYARTDNPAAASLAVKRYLSEPGLVDSVRAAALLSMARQYSIRAQDLANAEPYVDQLDAMSNAVTPVKITVHRELFRRYQSYDIDLGAQKHALASIALWQNVKAEVRSSEHPEIAPGAVDASELLAMYQTAAIVDGNFGREADAIRLLQRARREHPEIPAAIVDSGFRDTLERLKLIGQHASNIESEHWFNAPDGMRRTTFSGNVTVLGFTAHWCPPCQATYGPLQAMSDSMSGRGARFLFVTTFYGYVGSKRNLQAEQEREATRIYYEGRKITFPIAMLGNGYNANKMELRESPPAFMAYFLQQIPQSVIIDRHGIIRRIIVGWDPANNVRLPALLNRLLREK